MQKEKYMQDSELSKLIDCDNTQKLKHRENSKLEFKANFNKADFALYAKTLAAFANNQGGCIIFGVKDKPREAIGMSNDNFENFDNQDLSNFLNEHFSPEIQFNCTSFQKEAKKFAAIEALESSDKPVMCIKNGGRKQELAEGEIYYRYNARTQKIKYVELKKILDDNLENERKKWMEHIENIAKIGPKNVKMLDLSRGEINTENGKIVIDKNLLQDIRFIEEGKFVEKDGAPTLKLIGEIQSAELIAPNLNLDKDFYTTKELLSVLNINIHHAYFRGILAQYPQIQQDENYFQSKNNQKYYSKSCLEFLKSENLNEVKIKEFCKKHNVFKKSKKA